MARHSRGGAVITAAAVYSCITRSSFKEFASKNCEKNKNDGSKLSSATPKPNAFDVIVLGGLSASTLDSIDGVVAFGVKGMNPIHVLQYIASGLLGDGSFQGGLKTAGLGAGLHFCRGCRLLHRRLQIPRSPQASCEMGSLKAYLYIWS